MRETEDHAGLTWGALRQWRADIVRGGAVDLDRLAEDLQVARQDLPLRAGIEHGAAAMSAADVASDLRRDLDIVTMQAVRMSEVLSRLAGIVGEIQAEVAGIEQWAKDHHVLISEEGIVLNAMVPPQDSQSLFADPAAYFDAVTQVQNAVTNALRRADIIDRDFADALDVDLFKDLPFGSLRPDEMDAWQAKIQSPLSREMVEFNQGIVAPVGKEALLAEHPPPPVGATQAENSKWWTQLPGHLRLYIEDRHPELIAGMVFSETGGT